MRIEEFDFELPESLIAQTPLDKRDASRLLVLDKNTKSFNDKKFTDFVDLLNPNDLLIFNDTRVIKARLFGKKITGGKAEIMIERILDGNHALAHLKTSKKILDGTIFEINKDMSVQVIKKKVIFFILNLIQIYLLTIFSKNTATFLYLLTSKEVQIHLMKKDTRLFMRKN